MYNVSKKIMRGFEEVEIDIFMEKSISKCTKLCTCFHVSDAYEKIDANGSRRIFVKKFNEKHQNSFKNNTYYRNVMTEVN